MNVSNYKHNKKMHMQNAKMDKKVNNQNQSAKKNIKFSASNNSTPDTETFSEQQHQVDTSESDEESVSEVDSFPLDHASTEELPDDDSCSESDNDHDDENDDEDEEESSDIDSNDEEEDEEEDEDEDMHAGSAKKFLLAADKEIERSKFPRKVSLEALLEAAVKSEKIPVLRNAQAALDDAAQTITRMRSDVNPRDKNLLSRTLIAACTDNDVNAVRRLLIEGNTLNDATDDGDSLLSLACSAGYYELAQVLLAMSAQVEDRGQKNDCTPLMEAASAGHIEIIELLIRHGADVNAQSSTGNTPLMYACAGGHVAAVKSLLAHGANVEDHNENGHTPLMEAASAGHVEVAKILLDHGAGINTHSNEFKESALTLACYKGHLDMVRFLLEAGADQEHKTDEMHTALMEASMDGHVEVARLLLDSGAQVNMPTDSFESPLTLAACGGHVDLAMLLIERGANIEEVNDEGYTPLMEAAREGHDEMVSLLLTQGANINAQTEETQETALTLACCGGFLEVADYLIKHGADIELGASTPLMEAAQEGHLELVKFLLENKADVHAQTQTGDTALTYACENGHTDVAEVLLYYGAELEHLSEGGRTPLMKACRAGHICTVKFLIQKGADVNRQTTNNDHTPLSLASAGGHQQVVELLLSHGSDPFHKLKDNSTMLIEAAKGGHTSVVQLLLDFPQSVPPGTLPQQQQQQQLSAAGNQLQLQAPPLNLVHIKQQQHQQQQQQLKLLQQQPHQQQPHLQHQHHQLMTQQQLLQAPPGLHDVTDVIRLPDPPGMFQQHHHMVGENIQELPAASTKLMSPLTNQNFIIDPNIMAHGHATAAASVQQTESILTQMKLLQSAGFKDGLAYGLTKAQSAVSQIVNQQQQQNNINNINPTGINPQHQQIIQNNLCMPSSSSSGGSSNNNKQKNVSRKNRHQLFTDGTMSTAEMPRLERTHPISEEEVIYLRNTLEEQIQQKLDNTLQKNIQFINDSGPPPTLLPSGTFVDITTPAQGKQGNNTFMPSTFSSVGQLVINTDNANTSATGTNTNNLTTGGVNANKLTHITAPSEVSQSTAISDRPKAKPVSKKDVKNSRKLSSVLLLQQQQRQFMHQQPQQEQQNSMPAPPNVDLTKPKTELTDTTIKSDGTIEIENVPGATVLPRIFDLDTFFEMRNLPDLKAHWSQKQSPPNADSTKQLDSSLKSDVGSMENDNVSACSGLDEDKSLDAAGTRNCSRLVDLETFQKMRLNNLSNRSAHWDPKVFKKIAQLIDPPKSPIEQPPDNTELVPPKSFSGDMMGDYSHMFDEIPAIQRKMILDRLTTKEMKKNHEALKCALDLEQTFGEELTNSIAMSLKREENKCADVFPSLEQSLESFNPDDVSGGELGDDTHGPIYNYEWVDEVMQALNVSPDISNAFHVRNSQWDLSVNDVNIMKLQEIAANINNQDLESYASLFGINTICKSKWGTPHWPQTHFPGHHLTSDCSSPTNDDSNLGMLDDEEDAKNDLATQNLLMTIDQQGFPPQLSMEQLQLITQLQHQQQGLPLLSATLDQQNKPNILLSGQQAIGGFTGTQPTQLHPGTAQKTVLTDAQQQTKFVFNVETDKTSQSLQLLFQLPSSVQDGQNQQPQQLQQQIPQIKVGSAQKTATVHPQNVAISTQTQAPPPTSSNPIFPQPGFLNYQQQQAAHMHNPQPRLWSKNYPQVQVSSGTQTNPTMMSQIPGHPVVAPGPNDNIITPSTSNKSTNVSVTIGAKKASSTTSAAAAASGGATSEKVSRKEKSRNGVRPVPAGAQNNYQYDHNSGLPTNYPNIPGSTSTGTTTDRTIDVDSETDSNHDTALTLACAGGHEDLVELLIKRGSNIEHRDKKGFTPLILAATAGHEKVVESLINCGAELEAQSERTKDTPLSLACSGGRYEVVELLLKVGANKEHRNVSDYTPLSLAASGGYVNIIKLLLNNGAEINSRTGSKLGISPLMLAAMNGHTAAVRLLLDMGSDINAQIETNRNTALTLACFQGRNEVVSLLLDRKANVEHRAKTGLTPLMEAASGGYIEVGRVLLDKGADVNAAPVPSSRDTALTIAADKGHLKFVELLLSRCAAVEVKNKKGNSPLWLAANGGHLGVVEALYNARADIDSQDNRKVSCLMAAFRKGHTKVVKWMVNHVTQFPSDQEMTRYINVVEKEVIDKCHECVKIIRAAKETQAAKANINASILLKELDMEKSREESRKAAAAKRRERKKRRKQEKREAQRKLVEGDQPEGSKNHQKNKNQKTERDEDDSDDSDSDKDDSNDEDDDDVEDEIVPANEKEEGDSGIDANSQGSCSSSDAKGATTKATLAVVLEASSVNNKKIVAKNANQRKKNQPITVAATAEASTSNSTNNSKSSSNRSSSSPAPLPTVKAVPEPVKPIREDIRKTRDQQRDLKNQRVPETTQKLPVATKTTNEKENVAPKEIEKPVVKVEKKTEYTSSVAAPVVAVASTTREYTQKTSTYENSSALTSGRGRGKPTVVFGNSRLPPIDRDDYEIDYFKPSNINKPKSSTSPTKQPSSASSISKISQQTQSQQQQQRNSTGVEEEWKEVVRKCSVQQTGSGATASATPAVPSANEIGCKKIQVPLNAISRVIGRGGSNINAIRAATGAHIEVEKQGKTQGDRSITIKGVAEATKQAHNLIATLIKDPDADILSMLPRNNLMPSKPTASSVSSVSTITAPPPTVAPTVTASLTPASQAAIINGTNVWEKSLNSVASLGNAVKTTTFSASSKSVSAPGNSGAIGVVQSKATTPTQQLSANKTPTSRSSVAKNLFSGQIPIMRPLPNQTGSKILLSDGAKKGIIATPTATATKTSTSIASSIQALKNSIQNAPTVTVVTSASTGGSFASKLGSNTMENTKKQLLTGMTSATQNNRSRDGMQSPSKQQSGINTSSGLPTPFTNNQSVPTSISSGNMMNKSMYDSSVSGTATTTTITRSITPIGPPSRNITSSPHSLHIVNTLDLSTPSMGWNNNVDITHLQHKMNDLHVSSAQALEYSLFNDNYINKWAEHKSNMVFNPLKVSAPFIESEPPVQVDASKAPGYRGNAINSPVSSKASSNSATPPSTVVAPQTSSNNNSISSAVGGQMNSSNTSAGVQNQSNNQTTSYGEMNVIKPIGQGPIQPPGQGLAVQRPSNINNNNNINNNSVTNNRSMDFGRSNLFEPLYSSDSMQQSQYNSSQSHFGMNSSSQQPPMSRLNPKASAFSSVTGNPIGGKMSSNQFGNNYNNMAPPTNNNSFMKSPGGGRDGSGNGMSQYNRPSMQQQQNLQQQGSRGWFQDLGNLGGTMDMSGSPSMSPNNNSQPPQQQQQQQQQQLQQNNANGPPPPVGSGPQGQEDRKSVPRPIGTERQSWKYSYGPYGNSGGGGSGPTTIQQQQQQAPQHPGSVGGNILEIDSSMVGSNANGTPWNMDKSQQQQQQQQQHPWQMPPHQPPYTFVRNLYDEIHMQDLMSQYPMDYSTGGQQQQQQQQQQLQQLQQQHQQQQQQQQSGMNYLRSGGASGATANGQQYHTFMGGDMGGNLADLQQYDFEKPTWSATKWTH